VGEWAEQFPAAARTPSAQPLGTAMIEALRAASVEQPLLVVLDDAHWLDDASLGVLEALVRDLAKAPLLVVLTTVPEPTTDKLAQLRAQIGRETPGVVLRPGTFDEEELHALVRWAFPKFTDEQHARLSRRIAADSAGVPLLAVEICHAIAQGLDLESTSGAWPRPLRTLDQTMPGDLPETIVAAIRVSFNCLSAPAQAALRAAGVLGDRVPAERIGKAAALAGPARDGALDELEWRRWLVADAGGYGFVAKIVREVVGRDMVTEGQRQRILSA
jgi:predicted ATPase